MNGVAIRAERPGDAAAIEAVTVHAFATAEHASGTEQAIVAALRAAGALSLSLVAEHEGQVVGHIAFSPVSIGGADAGWFGLGPVSVDPAWQRRGIGAQLVQQGLARLRAAGARGCVLLGDPSYYGRFGFRADPALVYPGVPAQYFQALAFTGPMPSGVVAYHLAFEL